MLSLTNRQITGVRVACALLFFVVGLPNAILADRIVLRGGGEIQGAVLYRTAAYLVCGLVGTPLGDDPGPWVEALLGFAQVTEDGKLAHLPEELPRVEVPSGETWDRLAERMRKLLRLR